MSKGVSFSGNGEQDAGSGKESTSAPNVGQGGSKGIVFSGNGGSDVTHSMESTRSPNGSIPSGKGEFISPVETGY